MLNASTACRFGSNVDLVMHTLRPFSLGCPAGLVAARMMGAREASGDVLIFLDSHVEVCTYYRGTAGYAIVVYGITVTCGIYDILAIYTCFGALLVI